MRIDATEMEMIKAMWTEEKQNDPMESTQESKC